jgi:hypothetical protein
MFDKGVYEHDWYNNMLDFLHWCNNEIKKCQPTGICGQSVYITSGKAGFDSKYPTLEDAYKAYEQHVNKIMEG